MPVKESKPGERRDGRKKGTPALTVSKSAGCKRFVNPARVIKLRVLRIPISLDGPGPESGAVF